MGSVKYVTTDEHRKMKMFELVVVSDTNDADYITCINDITQEELDYIMPMITAIKEFTVAHTTPGRHYCNEHNYPDSDYSGDYNKVYSDVPEEIREKFNEYVDRDGNYGCHSIVSIYYYDKPSKIVLL